MSGVSGLIEMLPMTDESFSLLLQGPHAGGDAAVGGAQPGAGAGATQEQEAGGVDAEAGRRDEADGRAAVPDDPDAGGSTA